MYTFICGGVSDRGDRREENQDSILFLTGAFSGQPAGLFLVADGMGGLSYGAEVSRYAAEQFRRWWEEDLPSMLEQGLEKEEDIRELIEQEIWDINQAVFRFKESMSCRSGSTLSLLLLYRDRYYIENLGDSRVYRMREGRLRQLTKDQAAGKNKLTMCIGMFPVPQSLYQSGTISDGDIFLICSDGLYNPLSSGRMEAALKLSGMTAGQKAEFLRAQIREGDASDNVSAIVVSVAEERKAEDD